ncbi:hypothetical protein PR048_001599 [Dryococelus australis]|uniref:Uncharacterized protein n=1 Tax=Dryococelus australis TaxID=614101 RepID=A0ABQ9IHT4_9NEOP|nr:hypothetical protein PR048_001599 [Dryococelus australis]
MKTNLFVAVHQPRSSLRGSLLNIECSRDIVRHDSHLRKPGVILLGERTRFTSLRGERPSRCATAAPRAIVSVPNIASPFSYYPPPPTLSKYCYVLLRSLTNVAIIILAETAGSRRGQPADPPLALQPGYLLQFNYGGNERVTSPSHANSVSCYCTAHGGVEGGAILTSQNNHGPVKQAPTPPPPPHSYRAQPFGSHDGKAGGIAGSHSAVEHWFVFQLTGSLKSRPECANVELLTAASRGLQNVFNKFRVAYRGGTQPLAFVNAAASSSYYSLLHTFLRSLARVEGCDVKQRPRNTMFSGSINNENCFLSHELLYITPPTLFQTDSHSRGACRIEDKTTSLLKAQLGYRIRKCTEVKWRGSSIDLGVDWVRKVLDTGLVPDWSLHLQYGNPAKNIEAAEDAKYTLRIATILDFCAVYQKKLESEFKAPAYLEIFSALEVQQHGSDKGDITSHIKCANAAKRKALNWGAPRGPVSTGTRQQEVQTERNFSTSGPRGCNVVISEPDSARITKGGNPIPGTIWRGMKYYSRDYQPSSAQAKLSIILRNPAAHASKMVSLTFEHVRTPFVSQRLASHQLSPFEAHTKIILIIHNPLLSSTNSASSQYSAILTIPSNPTQSHQSSESFSDPHQSVPHAQQTLADCPLISFACSEISSHATQSSPHALNQLRTLRNSHQSSSILHISHPNQFSSAILQQSSPAILTTSASTILRQSHRLKSSDTSNLQFITTASSQHNEPGSFLGGKEGRGLLTDFHTWESCRTMLLADRFSRGTHFSPRPCTLAILQTPHLTTLPYLQLTMSVRHVSRVGKPSPLGHQPPLIALAEP